MVLAACLGDTPVVGMNLVFDFTMLDRNCRRVGVTPLADRCEVAPVIDAFVLDKHVDPYRKGKGVRKLSAIAPLYRVPFDDAQAHGAEYDALAAARVVWRIGRVYPPLGQLTAREVHNLQVAAKADQDKSFGAYLRRKNESDAGLDGAWPVKPLTPVTTGPLEDVPLW